jgi:heat shock protein HtpX
MADRPAPVLVYDRLDANRRHTRFLLAAFVVLLLPLVCGTAVLVSFFVFILASATAPEQPVDASDLFRLETPAEILVFLSIALPITAVIACIAHLYNSLSRLQQVWGGPVSPERDPDLLRTVDNLCLGAGLPSPTVYIIETADLNAFATGRDPDHASLVVTRGLLRLLDRRELAGVLAHELSHIGNRDTALNAVLATVVRTIRLPLTAAKGLNPLALSGWSWLIGGIFALPAFYAVASLSTHVVFVILPAASHGASARHWIAALTPVYALLIAPAAAGLLRKTTSKERTFLADADAALLTRDPEGVALALAKIGAAGGAPMETDIVLAQMYFVDPTASSSGRRSSHPPIAKRIELLANMGNGIPESELTRAVAAGTRYREGLRDWGGQPLAAIAES